MTRQGKRVYSKATSTWAVVVGIAANPQDITSNINLHIELSRRRAQFHFCKIKSKQNKKRQESKNVKAYNHQVLKNY
jgi:hypothetical protein